MKRNLSMILVLLVCMTLVACNVPDNDPPGFDKKKEVVLEVVTTFAGTESNVDVYRNAYKDWETETGNKVEDMSVVSDEMFKTKIITDFETNSEPDVLFFFNGADANSFIEAGKVVSIEDIRKEYPEYVSNMIDEKIPPSLVDGKQYAVPVNGFWEAMFVNTEILEKSGVDLPGADYTWDQFLIDCQKIKDAGYIPASVALGEIPHYWWEACIFNRTGIDNHIAVPESVDSKLGQAWVAGINDIKDMYNAGFFPENTLSLTEVDSVQLFTDEKAAFLVDGSWRVGSIVTGCQTDATDPATLDTEKLDKFSVTYFPGTKVRKATDVIGGMSMGYYITKKAWDNPEKRDVAVSFVEYMTSDEIVPDFSQHTIDVLKERPAIDGSKYNGLQIKCMAMMSKYTTLTLAVQDIFNGDCRISTFAGMPDIVLEKISVEDAVAEGLSVYYSDK